MFRTIPILAIIALLIAASCGDDNEESPLSSTRPATDTPPGADSGAIDDGRTNPNPPVQDQPNTDTGDVAAPPADTPLVADDEEDETPAIGDVDIVDIPEENEVVDGPESPVDPVPPEPLDDGKNETPVADIDDPLEVEFAPLELPSPTGENPPLEGTFLDIPNFPMHYVFVGAGKDAIPALTNPRFVRPSEASYLREDDLVLGLVVDGEAKAYPENIGWWHEIVNDQIGSRFVSVAFCPLTGTGLVFDATDEFGGQFELGVSGLLFNSNLVMYDRRDNQTLYPQLIFTAISGPRQDEALELLPVVETTWNTWRRLYPDTEVIAVTTGWNRSYTEYPYGNYRTDDGDTFAQLTPSLFSNINPDATSFGAKDKVLGVRLNGDARAYLFDLMDDRLVINDEVGDVDIVVVWDRQTHLAIPYARQVGDQILSFDYVEDRGFPFSLIDEQTQSIWNIKGEAIEGPLQGAKLTQVPAHTGFWFSWVTFWQNTRVWPQ